MASSKSVCKRWATSPSEPSLNSDSQLECLQQRDVLAQRLRCLRIPVGILVQTVLAVYRGIGSSAGVATGCGAIDRTPTAPLQRIRDPRPPIHTAVLVLHDSRIRNGHPSGQPWKREDISVSARLGAWRTSKVIKCTMPIKAFRVPSHIGAENESFIHRTMDSYPVGRLQRSLALRVGPWSAVRKRAG